MADPSLGADYFEDVFAGDPDPWGLESRPYEAEKHARTADPVPTNGHAPSPLSALGGGEGGGEGSRKLP